MKVSISYSLASLHEASRFIWEHNESIPKWPDTPKSAFDVMNQIRDMMVKGALKNAEIVRKEKTLSVKIEDEWVTFTGTGGYYVIYDLIDDTDNVIQIGIDILVDPSISHPNPGYVTEELEMPEELDNIEQPV